MAIFGDLDDFWCRSVSPIFPLFPNQSYERMKRTAKPTLYLPQIFARIYFGKFSFSTLLKKKAAYAPSSFIIGQKFFAVGRYVLKMFVFFKYHDFSSNPF